MGLNEAYTAVKDTILLIDPLPDLDKAFSMVQQAEKQRTVHQTYADPLDS